MVRLYASLPSCSSCVGKFKRVYPRIFPLHKFKINVLMVEEGLIFLSFFSRGAYLGLYVGPNLPPLVRVPIEGLHTHEQVSGV